MGGGERKKLDEMAREQTERTRNFGTGVQQAGQDYRNMGQGQREQYYTQMQGGWDDYRKGGQLNSMFGQGSGFQDRNKAFDERSYKEPDYQRSGLAGEAANAYRNMGSQAGKDFNVDESRLGEARNTYSDFMNTGGVDAGLENEITGIAGSMRKFGEGGGNISDADKARMRGGGVYDEFSKTGGLSDLDRANIRSRANSIIPANFARANAEASRSAAVQGGYGPGADIMKNQLRRQATQDSAASARDAEIGIMNQVNQGRLAGAGGMASSEGNLQSLISQNTMAGLSGAGGLNMGLAGMKQAGREFGATGSSGLEMGVQGMKLDAASRRQQAMGAGAAGLANLSGQEQDYLNRSAEGRARTGEMNVNRQDDRSNYMDNQDKYQYEQQNQRDLTGMAGLQSMYGMGPSGMEQYADQIQSGGMNQESQNLLPYLNFREQMNPSWQQNLSSVANAVGQIGGGIAGGMTGMGAIGGIAGAGLKAARGIQAVRGAGNSSFGMGGGMRF